MIISWDELCVIAHVFVHMHLSKEKLKGFVVFALWIRVADTDALT